MKDLAHVKNEILYASLAHDYVLTQLNTIIFFVIYLYFVTLKWRTCYDWLQEHEVLVQVVLSQKLFMQALKW